MTRNYEDIFTQRGSGYDQAMRRYPRARDEEFSQLIDRADMSSSARVADIPAGGGYLKNYLPTDCIWLGHEPCASFKNHGAHNIDPESLLPLPWHSSTIDTVLSLAGVHHIDDKKPLFQEIHRVLKTGGRFVLSDVAADSAVASFLDDYVGRYNSTGHEGIFLDEQTTEEISAAGLKVKSIEQVDFHWRFACTDDMENFCNRLFDISKAGKGQTLRAISDILCVDKLQDSVGMCWSLMTIVADKVDS